jgi:hypothetical protein
MSLTVIHKKYKPNMAIDMVRSAIRHYRSMYRPIEKITLAPHIWRMWVDGMLEHAPEREEDLKHFEKAEFRMKFANEKGGEPVGVDMEICKGSKFMIKSMEVKLREKVAHG